MQSDSLFLWGEKEGGERKRIIIRYHIFHGTWDFVVFCHVPPRLSYSQTEVPHYIKILYAQADPYQPTLLPSLNLSWIHCLFPKVEVNQIAQSIQVQHGLLYTYTTDLRNSIGTVALDPSPF